MRQNDGAWFARSSHACKDDVATRSIMNRFAKKLSDQWVSQMEDPWTLSRRSVDGLASATGSTRGARSIMTCGVRGRTRYRVVLT